MVGNRIVGSVRARIEDGDCTIGRLIVDPQHQGQGIGTALLVAIEKYALEAKRFTLFTGSRSEANIQLYQRHGYLIVRTEQLSPAAKRVFLEKPRAAC